MCEMLYKITPGEEPGSLKEFLDAKADYYNNAWFVANDPVSIPHRFSRNDDIEISALITALISWGNRKAIIKAASGIMERLDHAPADFVMNHHPGDLSVFDDFRYRTFCSSDLCNLLTGLQQIVKVHGSLEAGFAGAGNTRDALIQFRQVLFEAPHLPRFEKHISNVSKGSAAKRLNMFLRWMVRSDRRGVDFGIWNCITPDMLMLPLDLHSGRVARSLGLLSRNADDWKAVEELTAVLRKLDSKDPTRYDYALFGLGMYEDF